MVELGIGGVVVLVAVHVARREGKVGKRVNRVLDEAKEVVIGFEWTEGMAPEHLFES